MQWGAPSGQATLIGNVIEIIPNVTGEVTEVMVNGSERVKKDDILFKIDPITFEANVGDLSAQLKLAKARLSDYSYLF